MKKNNKNIVQKVVLSGAVYKKDKILIVKRHEDEKILPGMWELPSGRKEPLEDWHKGLVREVEEETGLEVEVVAPINVFNYVIEKEEIRDTTQINFLVKPVDQSQPVKLSEEHCEFTWIENDKINEYNLSENIKQAIAEAFNIINIF